MSQINLSINFHKIQNFDYHTFLQLFCGQAELVPATSWKTAATWLINNNQTRLLKNYRGWKWTKPRFIRFVHRPKSIHLGFIRRNVHHGRAQRPSENPSILGPIACQIIDGSGTIGRFVCWCRDLAVPTESIGVLYAQSAPTAIIIDQIIKAEAVVQICNAKSTA